MCSTMNYSLQDFTNIIFTGFDYTLPKETLDTIQELNIHVGSPTYIRTPSFIKKDNELNDKSNGELTDVFKRKKKNRNIEITDDSEWDTLRTFQATKIVQKEGLDSQIDLLRTYLNKMTEKNYTEQSANIITLLKNLIEKSTDELDMTRIGNSIFEIASNNRFYSKLYSDLYTLLINNFEIMNVIFENNFKVFLEIFNNIEHANPNENYDHFCKVNKDNEKRKSLSSFFVNLTINKIITIEKMKELICNLLTNLVSFISIENKKSEVDELVENIFILYNKEWMEKCDIKINDKENFMDIVVKLAHSKPKDYPSLSNKTIFKFMDMIEM